MEKARGERECEGRKPERERESNQNLEREREREGAARKREREIFPSIDDLGRFLSPSQVFALIKPSTRSELALPAFTLMHRPFPLDCSGTSAEPFLTPIGKRGEANWCPTTRGFQCERALFYLPLLFTLLSPPLRPRRSLTFSSLSLLSLSPFI